MSFGKRRPKPTRAQLRPSNPIALQQGRSARQRDRLARLAVVGVAVLVTAAIVHGSGPPFTYRLGQRPGREIRVNVPEFERRNRSRPTPSGRPRPTRSPPLDGQRPGADPRPRRAARRPGRRRRQGRRPRGPAREPARDLEARTHATFDDLKAATDTPERRDDLHRQIAEAFAPLIRDGVLGPDPLPRHEESSRTLAVRALGQDPAEAHLVPRDRVVPERVAKPDGPVCQRVRRRLRDARLGPILFDLVAEQADGTPTLTYEERYTTQQREAAASQRRGRLRHLPPGRRPGRAGPGDHRGAADPAPPGARRRPTPQLGLGAQARRVGSVDRARGGPVRPDRLLRASPRAARSPATSRRIAALCGLVVVAIGLVRLLALQPWDAELIPVAIDGDDPGHRLQPALRADGHLRALPADEPGPGDGHRPLPGPDGGDRGGRAARSTRSGPGPS